MMKAWTMNRMSGLRASAGVSAEAPRGRYGAGKDALGRIEGDRRAECRVKDGGRVSARRRSCAERLGDGGEGRADDGCGARCCESALGSRDRSRRWCSGGKGVPRRGAGGGEVETEDEDALAVTFAVTEDDMAVPSWSCSRCWPGKTRRGVKAGDGRGTRSGLVGEGKARALGGRDCAGVCVRVEACSRWPCLQCWSLVERRGDDRGGRADDEASEVTTRREGERPGRGGVRWLYGKPGQCPALLEARRAAVEASQAGSRATDERWLPPHRLTSQSLAFD